MTNLAIEDMTAIGTLSDLREAKVGVPQDTSIVGFDDVALAAYVEPPLTNFAQWKYEIGQLAMGMLLDLLYGKGVVHNIVPRGELTVRASCRPINEKEVVIS